MFLIAMLVVFTATVVFAVQNPGVQDFNFLGYVWRVALWVPAAIGVGAVTVLLLLQGSTSGLGYRFRQIGHERTLGEHRGVIADLRDENARLREELAARRAEVSALRSGAGPAAAPSQPSWRERLLSR